MAEEYRCPTVQWREGQEMKYANLSMRCEQVINERNDFITFSLIFHRFNWCAMGIWWMPCNQWEWWQYSVKDRRVSNENDWCFSGACELRITIEWLNGNMRWRKTVNRRLSNCQRIFPFDLCNFLWFSTFVLTEIHSCHSSVETQTLLATVRCRWMRDGNVLSIFENFNWTFFPNTFRNRSELFIHANSGNIQQSLHMSHEAIIFEEKTKSKWYLRRMKKRVSEFPKFKLTFSHFNFWDFPFF